jgi:Family of unknown function (DUF6081)
MLHPGPGVHRTLLPVLAVAAALGGAASSGAATTTKQVYDAFGSGYTFADYQAKWSNIYGLLDADPGNGNPATRSFGRDGFSIHDAPFRGSADFSVFDHLKYLAISNTQFAAPTAGGSVTFSSVISARTPGTQAGRVVHGRYGAPFSWDGTGGPTYTSTVLEGQQAGAVMNMVSFKTGQLFDWFVSGSKAFALVERLPSSVTRLPNADVATTDPGFVGPGKMYTQIVTQVPAEPNQSHVVTIQYARSASDPTSATVTFTFDGTAVATVDHVGVPLDSPTRPAGQVATWKAKGLPYGSATYPGGLPAQGEDLGDKIDGFVIGHGTFSLLDAFPFQWGWGIGFTGPFCAYDGDPVFGSSCGGSVSIPTSQRLFGQGVDATFDTFTVTTRTP